MWARSGAIQLMGGVLEVQEAHCRQDIIHLRSRPRLLPRASLPRACLASRIFLYLRPQRIYLQIDAR